MTTHIPFNTLYAADHGWLQSRFHFSFAEYHDKSNMNCGALRVMNDDIIQPDTGFDTHPHKDMEIITYIIRGELTHQDSMGNKERLGRGAIQYLSAGTGITHSEKNEGDEEVHLIQTWILPKAKGLNPRYGSKVFDQETRHNRWLHLVGPVETDSAIPIYQDANMYVSELDKDKSLTFELKENRQLYLKVMEGKATINGVVVEQGDAAKISDEELHVDALSDVHILLVELEFPR
ncbi:pirin family protein [Sulfurovum sp.]|uniref:pirin family protein n=1 Tax=Sulfurovum sp. TaxID=1969726 RepID=UPI003569DD3F